jgi:uncharacterized protein YgbK (DUF1537 family)
LPRDSRPAAAEVFAGLPQALPDDDGIRESVRAIRAAEGLLLGVLDDDPTGSQAVHDVQAVTVLERDAFEAALAGAAGTCFVLTNTRSLDERAAAGLNAVAARGLMTVAERRGARMQLVSRSDSTLRGHVMAEVAALQAVRADMLGSGYDGVLLVPAFLEAGRLTAADIHWARIGPGRAGRAGPAGLVPVGETEFARDPAFGFTASDLRDFVAQKSGGTVGRTDIASIGLADIRLGGVPRVRELLTGLRDGRWVVVNATEYSDLDTVAYAALLATRAGGSFLFRTGPSFVRALAGMGPKPPLRGAQIWPSGRRGGHGLIVAGSHTGHTNQQLAALRAGGGTIDIELDVPSVMSGSGDVVAATARQVTRALRRSDVLLYTSRAVATASGADSLAVTRRVSAALSRTVRQALAAEPAWIIAKGGITSHDVALHGLGIRRATVAGQLFPGVISVLRPIDAAPEAIGMPYVVFAGNVGDGGTLAQVVAILGGEQEDP